MNSLVMCKRVLTNMCECARLEIWKDRIARNAEAVMSTIGRREDLSVDGVGTSGKRKNDLVVEFQCSVFVLFALRLISLPCFSLS